MPLMQELLTVSDPEFLVTFISSDKSNSHTALAMRNAFDSFL
ncbi:hypothetical protein C8D97_110139 [Pleionea mediterranea]|uniref:Uncharacterized protein n=1 Tax=Pleionea mediterranea TaxID=523701 RepID=A0A316FGJ2_9GAMM|nr:hypothetical protein C8D97_110139 [Pleionea mediterranea]